MKKPMRPLAFLMMLILTMTSLGAGLSAVVPGPGGRLMGDVDGDGYVNIGDIIKVRDYIFGAELDEVAKLAADVNFDGVITIADILCIRDIIFGLKDIYDPPKPTEPLISEPTPTPSPTNPCPCVPSPIRSSFPENEFSPMGPGSGGLFTRPQVNPNNTHMLALGSDAGGSYFSSDQGKSFRQRNLYGMPWSFAFDPQDEEAVYACTNGGFFQSLDGGNTFKSLFPPEGQIGYTSVAEYGGGSRYWTSGGISRYDYDRPLATYAAAVDPLNSNILYAVSDSTIYNTTIIYKSTDKGATFERLNLVLPNSSINLGLGFITTYMQLSHSTIKIYIDPASPVGARNIYLIHNFGVVKFVDDNSPRLNAVKMFELEGSYDYPNLTGQHLLDFTWGYDPATKKTEFYRIVRDQTKLMGVNTVNALEKSTDYMQTWTDISAGIPRDYLAENQLPVFNYVAAANKDEIYLSILMSDHQAGNGGRTDFGVMKSPDGGTTWFWCLRLNTYSYPRNFINKGWREITHGPEWSGDQWGFGAGGDACILTNMGSCYATFGSSQ
ncbi:MAG: dockerin type I repeat-containing protein, partial [Clostridia bacterium]|nr:dockerin type I repeat-containing protein [Clostridia bacterium]